MRSAPAALVVLAKAPQPGRSKTRLCPPCSLASAAALAEAALADTLAAAVAAPCERRVVVLDGPVGTWLPAGMEVLPQRGGGLDERLAAAFDDVGQPALLVGMDTPQVTSEQLAQALALTEAAEVDAVLGPAHDGGYWAVGLRRRDPEAFLGVPMSTATTFDEQLRRFAERGLRTALLPPLRDVDVFADAVAVAALAPATRFAVLFAALRPCGPDAPI